MGVVVPYGGVPYRARWMGVEVDASALSVCGRGVRVEETGGVVDGVEGEAERETTPAGEGVGRRGGGPSGARSFSSVEAHWRNSSNSNEVEAEISHA